MTLTSYDLFVIEQYLKMKPSFPQGYHGLLFNRIREIYCPILWNQEPDETKNVFETHRLCVEEAGARGWTLAPILDSEGNLQLSVVDPNERYTQHVITVNEDEIRSNLFDPLEIDYDKARNVGTVRDDEDDDEDEDDDDDDDEEDNDDENGNKNRENDEDERREKEMEKSGIDQVEDRKPDVHFLPPSSSQQVVKIEVCESAAGQ